MRRLIDRAVAAALLANPVWWAGAAGAFLLGLVIGLADKTW